MTRSAAKAFNFRSQLVDKLGTPDCMGNERTPKLRIADVLGCCSIIEFSVQTGFDEFIEGAYHLRSSFFACLNPNSAEFTEAYFCRVQTACRQLQGTSE